MNRIATHIAVVLLALAGLLGATSCSQHDAPEVPVGPGVCYEMGFYLSVGELPAGAANTSASRTPTDGPYDPGDGLENYIDLNTLRVGVYTTDDKFISELANLSMTPISSSYNGKRYKISGTVGADLADGNFKIAVIANWPGELASMDFDYLFSREFDFVGGNVTTEQLIPMYGIKVINKPLVENVANDLGTINIIRAVAKIEVCFDASVDAEYWTFKQVPTLTAYTTKGLCAPTNITDESYYTGSWSTDYLKYTFIPESAKENVGVNLPFRYCESSKSYVLYLPEYRNTVNYFTPAEINLEFDESLKGPQTIHLLQNGQSYDFHRNVWYRLSIKKTDEFDAYGITVDVDVLPYHVVDLQPSHGIGGRPDM